MDAKKMAKLIHNYRRFCSMTDALRYSCTVNAIEEADGIFGMNFEKIFSLNIENQSEWFINQQNQAEMIRYLMEGKKVDEGEFQKLFGYALKRVGDELEEAFPIKKKIPEKLIILCFDDAIRDQYEIARPLLNEFGFGATFFIAEKPESPQDPGFEDKTAYMDWKQIRQLQNEGFEIANHTKNHLFGLQDMERKKFVEEVRLMEEEFENHQIKKPVSFAYPSGIANSNAVGFVHELGYQWGRGNCETGICGMRGMSVYEPEVDSPLAIPNFGDPDFYDERLFRKRIELAKDGKIVGFTYHSVSDAHWMGECSFSRQMNILKEVGCKVIAMQDLNEYIDPVKAAKWNS